MKEFTLFLILICSSQIFAQDKIGKIEGLVYDSLGSEIKDATVKVTPIKNNKLVKNKAISTTTVNKGKFSFDKLPFGSYELQIEVFWSDEIQKRRIKVDSQNGDEEVFAISGMPFKACSNISETKDLLSEKDKAEIVTEMLTVLNIDYQTKPTISTNKIKPQWFGDRRKDFIFLSDSEIQHRADTKGDFTYYRFSLFKIKGDCVVISLDYGYAQGKHSKVFYLFGERKTYSFRRFNGEWVKSLVSSLVS